MKKLLNLPVTIFMLGSFFLASCGNTNADGAMKAPVQSSADTASQDAQKESGEAEGKENEKDEKSSIAKPAVYVAGTDANAKTTENLQVAFKGETTASAKYAAYSKKAEQEGQHEIALLFKAASIAENIHAKNHQAVLQESGVAVPLITPEFTVMSTKENLQEALAGETYEATIMYPGFLTAANAAGNQLALISLNYAYKTEKKHKVFYEAALTALQNNTTKKLAAVYYVCPTCGNTYETTAPSRCGISMTGGDKFLKIISL